MFALEPPSGSRFRGPMGWDWVIWVQGWLFPWLWGWQHAFPPSHRLSFVELSVQVKVEKPRQDSPWMPSGVDQDGKFRSFFTERKRKGWSWNLGRKSKKVFILNLCLWIIKRLLKPMIEASRISGQANGMRMLGKENVKSTANPTSKCATVGSSIVGKEIPVLWLRADPEASERSERSVGRACARLVPGAWASQSSNTASAGAAGCAGEGTEHSPLLPAYFIVFLWKRLQSQGKGSLVWDQGLFS